MVMQEFGRADWYAFAGAEKFSDGSNPLIAEVDNPVFVLVVDKNGANGILYDENGENEVNFIVERAFDRELGAAFGNEVLKMPEISEQTLVACGLTKV